MGSIIEGKVRNLTEFGAFVEITGDIDGLIHVSDMSWTKRVKHPSEVLKKGDAVRARITNIDVANQRVSLSIKEFLPNEWDNFVTKYRCGDTIDGRVVNITDFGLFIDVYERPGRSRRTSAKSSVSGGRLEDHFKVGDWVQLPHPAHRGRREEGRPHHAGRVTSPRTRRRWRSWKQARKREGQRSTWPRADADAEGGREGGSRTVDPTPDAPPPGGSPPSDRH